MASGAATLELQDAILAEVVLDDDEFVPLVRSRWCALFDSEPLLGAAACSQRCWDAAAIVREKTTLMNHTPGPIDKARLLAVSAPHAGDWLMAMPISSCGLRLDNEAVRVAVGLRLGCRLCNEHRCPCGSIVDSGESTGCLVGWLVTRHGALNDVIHRAIGNAGAPSVLEPRGLTRSDDRRPDIVTMIPRFEGRCLAWDATVADSLAESHLNQTVHAAGAAAEFAAECKVRKYTDLSRSLLFVPVAVDLRH